MNDGVRREVGPVSMDLDQSRGESYGVRKRRWEEKCVEGVKKRCLQPPPFPFSPDGKKQKVELLSPTTSEKFGVTIEVSFPENFEASLSWKGCAGAI